MLFRSREIPLLAMMLFEQTSLVPKTEPLERT